jgi:hypothetical protein
MRDGRSQRAAACSSFPFLRSTNGQEEKDLMERKRRWKRKMGGHHRRDSDGLGEIVQEGNKCDRMEWDTVGCVYSDEKDAGLYLESLELLEQACKKQRQKGRRARVRTRRKDNKVHTP